MPSMNISLSDELIQYIKQQVAGGAYADAAEFVGAVVKAHQQRTATQARIARIDTDPISPFEDWKKLKAELGEDGALEVLEADLERVMRQPAIEMTEETWAEFLAEVRSRHQAAPRTGTGA